MLCLLPLLLLPAALAYPGGAPQGACASLEPYHGEARRNPMPSPYSITAPASASPGQTIQVTLSGAPFRGYMLQGVSGNSIAGQWAMADGTLDCEGPKDTATHTHGAERSSQTLQWVVPNMQGKAYIRGTVVHNYDNYYTNVYSNAVEVA